MSARAPGWALGALATFIGDDPHQASGAHLRILPSPILGLPVMPFTVDTATPDAELLLRNDVDWRDAFDRPVATPFDVTTDNPVIGAPKGEAAWFEAQTQGNPVAIACSGGQEHDLPMARRDRSRHIVTAPMIREVRLEQAGRGLGARWLPEAALEGLEDWSPPSRLGLPLPVLGRYTGLADAADRAAVRLGERGSLRRPRQERDAPAGASTGFGPGEALDRARFMFGLIEPDLRAALTDSSDAQALIRRPVVFEDAAGGTFAMPALAALLIAAQDADLARMLGFMDRFESSGGGPLTVFRVRAVFTDDPQHRDALDEAFPEAGVPELLDRIPDAARIDGKRDLRIAMRTEGDPSFDLVSDIPFPEDQRFFYLAAYAVCDVRAASARPPPPRDLGVLPGQWRAGVAPFGARRSLSMSAGFAGAAGSALWRDEGVGWRALNAALPGQTAGWRALLIPAEEDDAPLPSPPYLHCDEPGRLHDPDAGETVRYGVAQADLFGRWSDAVEADAPPLARPAPPAPVPRLDFIPDAEPATGAETVGTLVISAPMPWRDTLPPAARAIVALRVRATVGGRDFTPADIPFGAMVDTPPDGAAPARLSVDVQVPPGEASVHAVFVDDAGVLSPPGTASRIVTDPRPPASPVIDPSLGFASRPDALGNARYRLAWPAPVRASHYRIYFADEATALRRLAIMAEEGDPLAGANRDAVLSAAGLADRADAFVAIAPRLPKDAFVAVAETGSTEYEHAVGGGMTGIGLLRVVAVSAANVEAPFADAPLKPFATPGVASPPAPFLSVRPLPGDAPAFEIGIEIPPSWPRTGAVRLSRSRGPLDPADRSEVAIIDTFEVGADGTRRAIFRDTGALTIDPDHRLSPYAAYAWAGQSRAEPRAATPDAPHGQWSDAAPPVTMQWIPPDPPPAPERFSVGLDGVAQVVWTGSRAAGSLDPPAIEIYGRADDAAPEELLAEIPAFRLDAQGAASVALPFADPQARFRARAVDPIGRRSPFVATRPEDGGQNP